MAKIETTFIRPKELYTPETGETKVVYDGYQNNPHELITEDGFAGALDTAMPTALAKAQVIETTWQELKDKRDNGQLIAGSLCRITDYQCTTTQENTRSAGHQFDIVLLALSANKLAEEGWAMMHGNIYDVTFADGVIKRCYIYEDTIAGYYYVVDINTLLGVDMDNNPDVGELVINEEAKTAVTDSYNSTDLTGENLTYNYFQNSNLSAWKVWYCLDNDKSRFAWADEENGKGVIYRLIDEFNNGIKYDFKNIQFKRKLTNGQYDATNGTDTWCYTLNIWYEDMCQDASILGNTLPNDEGFVNGVFNINLGVATEYDLYHSTHAEGSLAFMLNNIVFCTYEAGGFYYGFYNISLGGSCYNITFGNNCYNITMGDNNHDDVFKDTCYNITMGHNCTNKTFDENTMGNFGNDGVELATKDDLN